MMLCFVVGRGALNQLSEGASRRLQVAFHPKTQQYYKLLFRTFIAFCVFMKVKMHSVDTKCVLFFLECLAIQNTSVPMLSNYVSAIKAMFILFHLYHLVLEDPKIKYFVKSVRIMDLDTLRKLVYWCDHSYMGIVYKAVFLTAFYGFLRLSNLAPHSHLSFDSSRHITAGDVMFAKTFVKIILKWSKTNQNRNIAHVLSLPKFKLKPMPSQGSLCHF